MSFKIDWIPGVRASCFHAVAAVINRQPCADANLAISLAEPAARFAEVAAEYRLAADLLLPELTPLSVECDDNRRLVESAVACIVTEFSMPALDALCDGVATLRATFDRANPRVADELQLRGPVLREQWEAYGPGLMRIIGQSADAGSVASQVRVVLVHPFLGGGGQAFPAHGLVTFEAVLANPVPELPEVVRLAWLCSQLDHNAGREPLAMIPHAVAAAEQLGLARSNHETVELARRAWHVG